MREFLSTDTGQKTVVGGCLLGFLLVVLILFG